MRARRPMGWLLPALVGAVVLLMVVAAGTGAAAFMASLIGPAWWLMPILMILVMAGVMYLVMMPMMGHGHEGAGHDEGTHEDPAAIAARRYASGEISREEYLRIKGDLEGGREP
ncbi:MAG: hypothetical protein AABY30_01350 [Candidatus Thermoplasmatota archaeon]